MRNAEFSEYTKLPQKMLRRAFIPHCLHFSTGDRKAAAFQFVMTEFSVMPRAADLLERFSARISLNLWEREESP